MGLSKIVLRTITEHISFLTQKTDMSSVYWEPKELSSSHKSIGRLVNRGKDYYLTLFKGCVEELNSRMSVGINIARKSMVTCGLIPDVDGVWKLKHLTKDILSIVNHNTAYFNELNPFQ